MSVHIYVVLVAKDGVDVVTASATLDEWTCLDQAADLLSAARRGTQLTLHVYDERAGRRNGGAWRADATGRVSPATRARQRRVAPAAPRA